MPSPLARLSQALSWLAFVAAVAFAIVWIVSGWRTWRAEWEYGRRSMIVLVSHGRLCVYRATLALPVRDRGGAEAVQIGADARAGVAVEV